MTLRTQKARIPLASTVFELVTVTASWTALHTTYKLALQGLHPHQPKRYYGMYSMGISMAIGVLITQNCDYAGADTGGA